MPIARGIYLEQVPAGSSVTYSGHMYLVFKDGSLNPNNWKVIRGGPQAGFAGLFLDVIAQSLNDPDKSIESTNDKYDVTKPLDVELAAIERKSVNISSLLGGTLENAWAKMVTYATGIDNAAYKYEFPDLVANHTANSNATVLSVLNFMNVDVRSIPAVGQAGAYTDAYYTAKFPGASNGYDPTLLANSADTAIRASDKAIAGLSILGRDSVNDQIYGTKFDDRLYGLKGNDSLYGGEGTDRLYSGAGQDLLVGGKGMDLLVAEGSKTQLWGGDLGGRGDGIADLFVIKGGSAIMDAETLDYAMWGGFRLTGGVQLKWSESGWATWNPTGLSGLLGIPSALLGLGSAAGLSVSASLPAWFRYGMTVTGQLRVEFAMGYGGVASVENYQLDLETGRASANIVAYREIYATPGSMTLSLYEQTVNLAMKATYGVGIGGKDPLVLDLDGDGLELTTRDNGVYFDMDADTFAERTAWVKSDDALLARDLNSNGKIDNINELFGKANQTGLAALKTLDTNNDNKITSADSAFSSLKVWRDLNGNGVTDAGELTTLSQNNIVSLSLTSTTPSNASVNGNIVQAQAAFTRSNGTTGMMGDVILQQSETDTVFLGNKTVSAAAALEPNLKGYGRLPDLHVSMTSNASLLTQVDNFSKLASTTPFATLRAQSDAILYKWAGVESVTLTAIGTGFDSRKLAFLETYYGYQLAPRDAQNKPIIPNNAEFLKSWADVSGNLFERLSVQGPLKSLFPNSTYQAAGDTFQASTSNALADSYGNIFSRLSTTASVALASWTKDWSPLLKDYADSFTRHDTNIVRDDFVVSSLVRAMDGRTLALNLSQLAAGLGITSALKAGTAGADSLARGSETGLKIYAGGTGDDQLLGGAGQDVYVLGRNFGKDTVIDDETATSGDRLRFAVHNSTDVTLSKVGLDLLIKVNGSTDQVLVKNQFAQPVLTGAPYRTLSGIEDIQFADGVILEAQDMARLVGQGTAAADTMTGTLQADWLQGNKGNDTLRGGDGGDLYVFAKGDGQDYIQDEMSDVRIKEADTLLFTGGVTNDDLVFKRVGGAVAGDGNDLLISIKGTTDSVYLKDQLWYGSLGSAALAPNYKVESIMVDQGSGFSWQDIEKQLILNSTTSGNDNSVGFMHGDVFQASAGNDTLSGRDGDDLYFFGRGSGQDIIEEKPLFPTGDIGFGLSDLTGSTKDEVRFGPGVAPGDLTFKRDGVTDHLIIGIKNTTDTLTIKYQFSVSAGLIGDLWTDQIDKFTFTDSTDVITPEQIMARLLQEGKTAGNDLIVGYVREDVLDGGIGNDTLQGYGEGDTYIFNRGYGQDTIIDEKRFLINGLDIDKVMFGTGIKPSDIRLSYGGTVNYTDEVFVTRSDLVMRVAGTTDSLKIEGQNSRGFAGGWIWQVEEFRFTDGTVWTGDQLRPMLLAASTTSGNDVVTGFFSDDTLTGGLGNDKLQGGNGVDTYLFNRGNGQDIIFDFGFAADIDTVRLGTGITTAETKVAQGDAGRDLVITFTGNVNDRIILNDRITNEGAGADQLQFADGTIWNYDTLFSKSIVSTSGNDLIFGDIRENTLVGGLGNDTLQGRGAGDTYMFSRGWGQDTIIDEKDFFAKGTDIDKVIFGAGITASDISVSFADTVNYNNEQFNTRSDITLSLKGTTDTIKIVGFNSIVAGDWYSQIEEFRFAENTVWTADQVRSRLMASVSTSGNDVIVGFGVSDTLAGGLGNDKLQGGIGVDTYLFNRNGGQDIIYDFGILGEIDTVKLGAGITTAETRVVQGDTGSDLVITFTGNANDRITLNDRITNEGGGADQLQFADGTIWNYDTLFAKSLASTSGNDIIYGDKKANTIDGGAGHDIIDGRDGADRLIGGAGNDTLTGGYWDNDTFVFRSGFGKDVITDFRWGAGTLDVIEFSTSVFANYAAVVAASTQVGTDVMITKSVSDTILVKDMTLAKLNAGAFLFVL